MNSVIGIEEYSTPKTIKVLISITLSKEVEVTVEDYIIKDSGLDEDGFYFEDIDYSNCDLVEAVQSQVVLPSDKFKSWNIDELEVIMKLLKFYAEWCSPCKTLEKIMDINNIPHDNIDIEDEENSELVEKYAIKSLPTVVLVDEDGTEVNRHVGSMTLAQIKDFTNIANQ